jgi:hypothetical protein
MHQPVRVNQLLVDESPIFALQIRQYELVFQTVYLGVMPGNRAVFDDHVIGFPPTDRHRSAFLKLIFSQAFVFELQK